METKERILAAIEHRKVDRVPTDFWATAEVQESLCDYFGIEEGRGEKSPWIGLNGGALSRGLPGILRLFDRLHIDGIFDVHPPYIGPAKREEPGITFNEWGFGYREKKYAYGVYNEQVHFPLSEAQTAEDLEKFKWPDPDWYDYTALPNLIEQCGGHAVNVGYSAAFTFHNYLRGLETSLLDTLLYPELTRELLQRLSDFFTEYHSRCFQAAAPYIDVSQVTDDWGSQTGLMVSPATFHEFYQPIMDRAVRLTKEYGIKVFHHDDGDCRDLLPELVDMKIDILNPIQYRCGDWDLAALKTTYGEKVCFHSGVDNQEILPLGTPEMVKSEVLSLIDTLGSDGTGFIIGSCHNLQPNTPLENIIALYEAVDEYGY
jgi:uroporphyrinogen decarboxylase